MTAKLPHRDVGPFVQLFRRIIRGRKYVPAVRFADELAARTQPPPTVPGGPYHKTSKIYYHTRDARHLVTPPIVITSSKQISAGSNAEVGKVKPVTPNRTYNPPTGEHDKGKVVDEPFEL